MMNVNILYDEFTWAAPGDDANKQADALKQILNKRRRRQ